MQDNKLGNKVKTEKVEQTIVMSGKRSYPVLFGAYSISKITLMNDGEKAKDPLAEWYPADKSVKWYGFAKNPKNAGYPSVYKVVSEMPIIPLEELRSASYDKLYRDGFESKYVQLDSDFPESVRQLAEKVTAKGKTPYEKMVLLQDYLKMTYTYTNTPDLSRKVHKDLVEGFLFDIKEGYCDYFSTSMVTMARSIGMPARWVKGFSTGHQDSRGPEYLNRAPEGPYTVTNADAHSWAEVYFGEDYGWVTFEATPGFDLPLNVSEDEKDNTPVEPATAEPEDVEPEAGIPAETNGVFIRWFISVAAGILLILGGYLLWRYRSALYYAYLRLRKGRELTSGEKVVVETGRWLSFMRRRGFTREDHETLREAVTRWKNDAPDMASPFDELLLQFEKAKYSPHAVSEQDWRALQVMLQNISRSLKKTYSH
ncbi:Protein-glutamine gamma-glutamyltransferase [compost metagenome]